MATAATIATIGDWSNKMEVPLSRAIAVSQDVFKKSASKICYEALWYMTQSSGKLSPLGARTRETTDNPVFGHLLRTTDGHGCTYKMARQKGFDMRRFYRFAANKLGQKKNRQIYANQKPKIAKIGNRGLAKKSWFWGWGKETRTAIPDVTTVDSIRSGLSRASETVGYILKNRLNYILKIMPSGWENEVERRATDRVMGKARTALENRFKRQVEQAAALMIRYGA